MAAINREEDPTACAVKYLIMGSGELSWVLWEIIGMKAIIFNSNPTHRSRKFDLERDRRVLVNRTLNSSSRNGGERGMVLLARLIGEQKQELGLEARNRK